MPTQAPLLLLVLCLLLRPAAVHAAQLSVPVSAQAEAADSVPPQRQRSLLLATELSWRSFINNRRPFKLLYMHSGTAYVRLTLTRTLDPSLYVVVGVVELVEGGATRYAEFVHLSAVGFLDSTTRRMALLDSGSVHDATTLAAVRRALGNRTRRALELQAMNDAVNTLQQRAPPDSMSSRLCPFVGEFIVGVGIGSGSVAGPAAVSSGHLVSPHCATELLLEFSPLSQLTEELRADLAYTFGELQAALVRLVASNAALLVLYLAQLVAVVMQIHAARARPSSCNPVFTTLLLYSTLTQNVVRAKLTAGGFANSLVVGIVVACASGYLCMLMELWIRRRSGLSPTKVILEASVFFAALCFAFVLWCVLPLFAATVIHLLATTTFFFPQIVFAEPSGLHLRLIVITCITCAVDLVFIPPNHKLLLSLSFISLCFVLYQATALFVDYKRTIRRDSDDDAQSEGLLQ